MRDDEDEFLPNDSVGADLEFLLIAMVDMAMILGVFYAAIR
jgi:hypothetical protein